MRVPTTVMCHLEDEEDINPRVGVYNKIPALCLGSNVTVFATNDQLEAIRVAIVAYQEKQQFCEAETVNWPAVTVQ